MRPGQNKRMRGRNNNNNNNRKGPNPLTRSYESNGPDVKIRGTAHHIGEKYLQLARDAQSSGDPVMAESYLQHAEHYFRLIAAAQQAQQQAQFGYQRPAGEAPESEEGDEDDDFAALPDRFASPSERAPQPQQPQPQPYEQRQPFPNGGGQPYDNRQDRQSQQPSYQDRQSSGERQDRPYDNRNGRGDRNNYQDRSHQDRGGQDRGGQDRGGQDRNGQDRGNYEARNNQDRQPRDYDNRGNFRQNRGPRDFRDGGAPRENRETRNPPADEPTNGLPAFITGPSRPASDNEPLPNHAAEQVAPADTADEGSLHMRPRRRRRPKPEFAGSEGEGRDDVPASDTAGE